MKTKYNYIWSQFGASSSMGGIYANKRNLMKAFNLWLKNPEIHHSFTATHFSKPQEIDDTPIPVITIGLVKTTTGATKV